MSSSPKNSTHGDWRVVYNEQDGKDERVADSRRTLANTLAIPKSMCILSDSKTEVPTVTELDPPKLKLPQLGSESIERVFPVRSVLSFDSTPSSALQTPSLEKLESPTSPFSEGSGASASLEEALKDHPPGSTKELDYGTGGPKKPDHLPQLREPKHGSGESSTSTSALPIRNLRRFPDCNQLSDPAAKITSDSSQPQVEDDMNTHPEDNIHEGGGALAAKGISRDFQSSQSIDNGDSCVRVQIFGVMLVIFELEGNFTVQAASNNSKDLIGFTPDDLFEMPSICGILPTAYRKAFVTHAEIVLDNSYDVELSGPEVFPLLIQPPRNHGKRLWCTMHTSPVCKDYIICELEAEKLDCPNRETDQLKRNDDLYRPYLQNRTEEPSKLDSTASGKQDNPTTEEINSDFDVINNLAPIIHRVSSSQAMESLIDHSVSGLRHLLLTNRATIYRLDGNRNGVVVADSVDPSLASKSIQGTGLDMGAFIKSAKTAYLRRKIRFSYASRGDEAQLVYRSSTHKPGLDLSHCYLQAAPKDVSQKENPSVCACMSIGIYVLGKLWGVACCQSYDEKFRLHPLLQRASWLMGETISSNIERLYYTLPFQERKEITAKGLDPKEDNYSSSDLLVLFGADYAAASIMGETKIVGKPPDSQEVLVLLEYLRAKSLDTVVWTTDILSDFEDLEYPPGFHQLGELFYIPLLPDGQDFIVFFRSQNESVPRKINTQLNKEHIESYEDDWSTTEIGKASILIMMYRTFTDIWQEKEAAMQNNQLLKLLLANSAHEFRTPLNAIINYLEIALDGNLNQETRENISRSHSASKSLVYIINDLLDLTNAENGQDLIKDEILSLSETLCEATDIFWEEARQKQVDLQVVQHSALPLVLGDQRRVRQVITNLISNAVQHTSAGAVTIESCIISEPFEQEHIAIEVAIHDTGSGMPQETVETLFCQLEQVSNSKADVQAPTSRGNPPGSAYSEKESVLGLGLALVARIVRNMNGQLSLKSEEGSGSCFKIRLKFPLPEDESARSAANEMLQEPKEKSTSGEKEHPQDRQDELDVEKEDDPLSCRCGDETSNLEELGHQNGSLVDVDIAFKSGESRSIALSASEPSTIESTGYPFSTHKTDSKTPSPKILVAEDDPINSTILRKRLEKFGYSVQMTGNGKECSSVFRENPYAFDAVLMDLQMPIVDGSSATKTIREQEVESAQSTLTHKRIPVFAVSASLLERDRQSYIDSGFDGWVMKPIDFQRVDALLKGVSSPAARNSCIYQPGMWEQGGWFQRSDAEKTTESSSRRETGGNVHRSG